MKKVVALSTLAFALVGCATAPPAGGPDPQATFKASVPTCREAKECEVKWSAARDWIVANAGMKLQHIQPDFMETYNPTNASTSLAARVTKKPQADGSYRFEVKVWCDNWIGCDKPPMAAMLDFNRTVTAAFR